ncbi:hypothetical protein JJV70_14810 [Streptomyces sp. JJ66]|uniref:hypothetical protein n=1 Tax=Streptomyces sp. JJ66 TaxID=2803843 RepID=UPI001C561006|nr:hypothetical protein [Streptomyces sp. JJ66]MBW1603348.1 hypothetical protein [Streptomyces sp. JJ66]
MPGEPMVQDREALAEIELYGELMIAASAEPEERLSDDRIDEVLGARPGAPHP